MANFIYFFPLTRGDDLVHKDRLRAKLIEERGLTHAFAGVTSVRARTSVIELSGKGPGGKSGVMIQVIQPCDTPLRIGYYPDAQEWHESPAGCQAWVGFDREYPPTPADLARGPRPAGHGVVLGDGHTWVIPIIRCPFNRDAPGRSQLPRDFTFDERGLVNFVRRPCDELLWEMSGVAWDHFFDREHHPTLEMNETVELILCAMARNYRIGRPEAQLLRLLNTTNWDAAVRAILDTPLIDEALGTEKKTGDDASQPAPDTSNALPGAPV
jgi:hypothetical protein